MAAQLTKGHTYNAGDIVDAADLNAHVDEAFARVAGGLISEQTAVAAASGDYVLIGDTSDSNKLKKALVSSLGTGVTSIVFTMPVNEYTVTNTLVAGVSTLTVGWKATGFSRNKVLAAPATATGAPSFRTLVPADVSPLHSDIADPNHVDWSLANVFAYVLTGVNTFTFENVRDGQSIMIRLNQSPAGTGTAAWNPGAGNTLLWRNGVVPVMTTGSSAKKDIYFFTAIGATTIYGYSEKNFS